MPLRGRSPNTKTGGALLAAGVHLIERMAQNPISSAVFGWIVFVGTQNAIWLTDAYTWYTHNYEAPFELNLVELKESIKEEPKLRSYCLVEGKLSDYYPEFAVDAIHEAFGDTNHSQPGIVQLPESDALRVNMALKLLVRSEIREVMDRNEAASGPLVFALTHGGSIQEKLTGKKLSLMVMKQASLEKLSGIPKPKHADGSFQDRAWKIVQELNKSFAIDHENKVNPVEVQHRIEQERFIDFALKRYSSYGLVGFPYYGDTTAREKKVAVKGTTCVAEE